MFKHIVKNFNETIWKLFCIWPRAPLFQQHKEYFFKKTSFSIEELLSLQCWISSRYELHLSICIFQFLCLSKMKENCCPLCFKRRSVFHISKILFLFLGLCGWKILEGTTPYKILINDKTYLIAANEVRVNLRILN